MNRPFEGHAAAFYLDGPPRQVPCYDGLLRMATMLLAEKAQGSGEIVVVGAGGGLEIAAMARAHPGWRFDGIDPSQDMLSLARQTTAPFADRVNLHAGYIDSTPHGPYDGATCILSMHFVRLEDRLTTLSQIRSRLRPGAPFVIAHISFPQAEPDRSLWIRRHLTYSGTSMQNMEASMEAISTRLTVLSPEDEESMLRSAGFSGVHLFYAGLSFRGRVAYAS